MSAQSSSDARRLVLAAGLACGWIVVAGLLMWAAHSLKHPLVEQMAWVAAIPFTAALAIAPEAFAAPVGILITLAVCYALVWLFSRFGRKRAR